MTLPLRLYTNPRSRGRVARWMLEETGQPYDVTVLQFGAEMQSPAYRALNPMAKVPTLTHGDTVVTENAAIVAYLADAFPRAGLAPPPGSPARGGFYRWLFFAAGPLEYAVTNRALGLDPPAERSVAVGYGSYERVIEALEMQLSRSPYLLGDTFSGADLYLGAHLDFGMMVETIPRRPAFTDYATRLTARPAYRRADALDNAEMPAEV